MTHKEIHQQLSDYVLGLLSPSQAGEVMEHLAGCTACRRTVHEERAIGVLVRNTLNSTTQGDAARLHQLMPPVPQHTGRRWIPSDWTGGLAPALVVLLAILGSLLMSAPESRRPMSLFTAATATATSTNTPTATIVHDTSNNRIQGPLVSERDSLAMPTSAVEPSELLLAAPTPYQPPTPVAASGQMAAN